MLPPYIIEELRRREQARREDKPVRELELPVEPAVRRPAPRRPEDAERGIAIIEVW